MQEIVSRILDGQAPVQLRAAAARGALPLPRSSLVQLYLFLRQDEDQEIRRAAAASLDGLSEPQIRELLEDPDCVPQILEFFAPKATRVEALAERIAFHRGVPSAALATLAANGNAAVIELVLTNQERLLSQPELLDRLSVNPALRADQRGRILELLDRASRRQGSAASAAGSDELSADPAEAARLLDVDVGELFAASEIIDGEEFEQADDPQLRGAYRKILTLNTAQKAILAMKGGREERMILIRDTNKIVSLSVLRNPRMRDEDVEAIARMRGINDEVLRQIGNSREWSKSYAVVNTLVNNPRTPQGISTNFIARLQNQDLKRLANNHDVPELVRRMAKRTLDTRTQKTATQKKKK